MLFWALIWAYFWLQHIYKTIKDSSYSARPVASRKANIRAAQGRLHRTSCGHSGQPAVPLAPVCERCRGVGGAPGGARASQRVTRPEERRGEREGQHHRMPQTDWRYFYWAPRRGPGCNYTTHTHTHKFMHAHTLLPDRLRKVPGSWILSLSFCLSVSL